MNMRWIINLIVGGWLLGALGTAGAQNTVAHPTGILRPNQGPASGLLTPVVNRPVYIVTFGDSIMWGQGLPESNKFRSIVAQWIRDQYQGTRAVVQIPTRAHSGAQIWVDPGKDGETGLPGEIPSHTPSVNLQVGLTVQDLPRFGATPDQVDLVLLDGGINDVDITNILNPTKHINDLHNLTVSKCVQRMRGLLANVRNAFPNAAIIVTGYYPIASDQSDMASLWPLALPRSTTSLSEHRESAPCPDLSSPAPRGWRSKAAWLGF